MFRKFKQAEKRILPYFDLLFYSGGILSPIITMPQIIKIYLYQDAAGVSFYSWGLYSLGALSLLFYGILHNQKPIIFLNACAFPFYLAVCIGVLLYGNTSI